MTPKKPKSTTMLAAIAHDKVTAMRVATQERVDRVVSDGRAKVDELIEDLDADVRAVFDRLDGAEAQNEGETE